MGLREQLAKRGLTEFIASSADVTKPKGGTTSIGDEPMTAGFSQLSYVLLRPAGRGSVE